MQVPFVKVRQFWLNPTTCRIAQDVFSSPAVSAYFFEYTDAVLGLPATVYYSPSLSSPFQISLDV